MRRLGKKFLTAPVLASVALMALLATGTITSEARPLHTCPERPPGLHLITCNPEHTHDDNGSPDLDPLNPDPPPQLTGCDLYYHQQGHSNLGWGPLNPLVAATIGEDPDVTWWFRICDPAIGEPCDTPIACMELRPEDPLNASPTVTPEQVRDDFWFCAEAWLLSPQVQEWPPQDSPAIVDIPTFVTVENWPPVADTGSGPACGNLSMDNFNMNLRTGAFSVTPCRGSVCVSISGEPSLSFDPGDGADPIPCQPPALAFDPDQDVRPQAEDPHACVHEYQQRTGSDSYQASVHVDWDVRWSTDTSSGTFDLPAGALTYEFTRQVDEVQSVITDADLD